MNITVVFVAFSWTVLSCVFVETYENFALHKPAWQSATLLAYKANLAVDGQKGDLSLGGGQCSASRSGKTNAEWRVDLEGGLRIHQIVIQYATGNNVWDETNNRTKEFLGFSIYISNTTNKDEGVLCFRDTNFTRATIPNPFNISCPYYGRYVIYYNNRTHPPFPDWYSTYAFTDLCEVEVYECPSPGIYGMNCSIKCSQNCLDGRCDSLKGMCLGCNPGYIGPNCNEECPEHFYGYNCLKECSQFCGVPGKCDIITGHCNSSCREGWTGDTCDLECVDGYFGQNCLEKCSLTCKLPGRCNKTTGHCNEGCLAGWKGELCEKACNAYTFGEDCTGVCGRCVNEELCHHVNGTCMNGCDHGFFGPNCTEECPEGVFGNNCLEKCSLTCADPGKCDRKTGHCHGGCREGWEGKLCERGKTKNAYLLKS